MPLSSIVSWLGIKMFPFLTSFEGAQMIFVLVAGLVPPLTAALAYSFTARQKDGILAGTLAVFSVFYLSRLPTTDSFGLYMLLGAAFFLSLKAVQESGILRNYLVLGILAGLMHLTRADGVIWLAAAGVGVSEVSFKKRLPGRNRIIFLWKHVTNRERIVNNLLVLFGYLAVMTPWFARNVQVFGVPFGPGGMRSLWLTEYNDLFAYPASVLNFAYWWESGLVDILIVRATSLWQNLQTLFAVQSSIFLFPLLLAGVWKLRDIHLVRVAIFAWLITITTMTILFPFSGARGGFFHSGSALQPLLWAVVPVGLNEFISWGVRRRGWISSQATVFFQSGLIVLAVGLSSFIFFQSFVVRAQTGSNWDRTAEKYAEVEELMVHFNAAPNDIVLVINPPAYYLASGRPAIAIPNGDKANLLLVAERYQAHFLVLEADFPWGLQPLDDQPDDQYGLVYLGEYNNTKLFRIDISGQ
ncbi:MAG: hypothetical protein IH859_09735 [Chloroflexi bacterium]|nr:hypothetical protein [Chloroflexota bacterium]